MTKSVIVEINLNTRFFSASEEESFNRIMTTALGSRVVRPHFGNLLYTLIDKTMNEEWMLDFRRFTLEAFFDENYKAWDKRLVPVGVSLSKIDATAGTVNATINFEDFDIEIGMGGF